MTKKRRYYTLLVRDDKNSDWQIEYGSYDRQDVVDEIFCLCDGDGHKKSDTKILTTPDDLQPTIDSAVDKLNGKRLSKTFRDVLRFARGGGHGWTHTYTSSKHVDDYEFHHSTFSKPGHVDLHMIHNPDGVAIAWWGPYKYDEYGALDIDRSQQIDQKDYNRSPVFMEIIDAIRNPVEG